MKQLRRLLPYYTPHRAQLITRLVLVIISTGITSAIPWFLWLAIDGIKAGRPLSDSLELAAAIVGVALFGGFLRYSMRQKLNGVSRHIEYDPRNDLFDQA